MEKSEFKAEYHKILKNSLSKAVITKPSQKRQS